MRISEDGRRRGAPSGRRRGLGAALVGAALLGAVCGAGPAAALDAAVRTPVPAAGGYRNAREAVRSGVRDYNAGDKEGAARALEYAAGQGHALALWKLGRMYAEGDGVPHDDLKAFEFFSKIADENADEGPDSATATVVSSAFTALGRYFLDGIKGSYVRPNVERAYEMFNYAASYYGDPNAQYNLARLYLDGTGVAQDTRQAARWFNLAAEKGHPAAQALLGQMLINGQGVPTQRSRGLAWLTLARDAADGAKDQWIVTLQEQAMSAASERDRAEAQAQVDGFYRRSARAR
ncbi:tetratricopeptide repeat protein [Methylobacterium sp. ID0610]|uniref:tetratricopeptide repeat protein n=1 Tax=Methylobacterium carpenticola TaxID=3344827 RepID=UPI003691122E